MPARRGHRGLGGHRLSGYQPGGPHRHPADRLRVRLRLPGAAPLPRRQRAAGPATGDPARRRRRPGALAGRAARRPARRRAPARGRGKHAAARPHADTLPVRPAGDAGPAGYLYRHDRHPAGRGQCPGRRQQPGRRAERPGGAHRRAQPGLRHLHRRCRRLRHAGAGRHAQPPRAHARRPRPGRRAAPGSARVFPETSAAGGVPRPTIAVRHLPRRGG